MTTAAEPEVFTSRIAEARRVLAAVRASAWPATREAMAAIGQARDYATGEIGVYCRLVSGAMDWTEFDADLMFFGGDPQAEAIAIAEARVLDAARAAMSRLAEYRRREAAMAEARARS
jgi:hypothetical protein